MGIQTDLAQEAYRHEAMRVDEAADAKVN